MNFKKLNEEIEKILHEEDDEISTRADEFMGIYKRKAHPNKPYSYDSKMGDYRYTADSHDEVVRVYYHPEKGFYTRTGRGEFKTVYGKTFQELWENIVEEARKGNIWEFSVLYDPEGGFTRNVPDEVQVGSLIIIYYHP